MIKVYFTASTSFDGKYQQQYRKIIELLESENCQIVSGTQIIDKQQLKADKDLKREDIFKREKERIEASDCVIAEVTHPSHGVGGEIVYALISNKPVLGLVYEDSNDEISPMISGNPSDNFFLERYTEENLQYVLNGFIKYIRSIKNRKGKLIVIDGGNGSGKSTQAKLLVDYLKARNIRTKYLDFPQYYTSFHGKTVAKFLRGEFGAIDQVSPYLASLSFALDRASVKKVMVDFLAQGGIIVANRYVSSNMAHQGAKIEDPAEREEFLKWVYELEYKVHRMPKENLVVYLDVPWQLGLKLTGRKIGRDYLKGKDDIEEKDERNRIESEKLFRRFLSEYRNWERIDCVADGKILPIQEIHGRLVSLLVKKGFIA